MKQRIGLALGVLLLALTPLLAACGYTGVATVVQHRHQAAYTSNDYESYSCGYTDTKGTYHSKTCSHWVSNFHPEQWWLRIQFKNEDGDTKQRWVDVDSGMYQYPNGTVVDVDSDEIQGKHQS